MSARTRAEQETILRWDAEDPRVVLYTASPVVAAKWGRLGYALTPFGDPAHPSGWGCTAPKGSVTVRRAHRAPRKGATHGGFLKKRPVEGSVGVSDPLG